MRQETHYPIGEAIWISAGIIMLLAFGDAFVLLALGSAIATMATAWWTYRRVQQSEQRSTELAPVTTLRPALTVRRDPKRASAPAQWRGPSAA